MVDEQRLAEIIKERGKIYGPPKENHEGIAMMWAPLLHPYSKLIAEQKPLPPHVIAQLMIALKLDRMRLTFHQDNYDDLRNYLKFAEEWQREHEEGKVT